MIERFHTARLATWPGGRDRPRHAREWLLAIALVLAAHALLLKGLDGVDPGAGARLPSAVTATVIVVRTLEPAAQAPPQASGMPATGPADPTRLADPPRSSGPSGRSGPSGPSGPSSRDPAGLRPAEPARADTARPDTPAPSGGLGARGEPAGRTAAAQQAAASDEAAAPAADALQEGAGPGPVQAYAGAPPPVWATRLPGDFVAHYRLQRGEEPARAVALRFEAAEGRYRLQLQGAGDSRGPEQASQGRLEASGLAPERYLDRRRARAAAAAANFDRARARITYSGAALEQPLFAGTQDRLSWIVQLAAIVDADPARWSEQARLPLYVTGVRGDAQLWVFTVRGRTTAEGPGGLAQPLLHLVREPERPYDLRVEAWLDPAQQHLPARLLLSPVPAGRPLNWTRIP